MSELENATGEPSTELLPAERPQAPPITSRFLYVDVSALRAKQLRRGAKVRLASSAEESVPKPVKPERMAMQEVREGLVDWALPDFKAVFDIR